MSELNLESEIRVGDVLKGHYVDMSPRYYRVVAVTPQKIKAQRLKVTSEHEPGTTTYGNILTMTKRGANSASWYGQINTKI
ncbi:Hypothetical protein HVR_LOCUS4 [uncultured virus]|nr:Hypothetical protein HVR_LOCUS4 [uncultured virus]